MNDNKYTLKSSNNFVKAQLSCGTGAVSNSFVRTQFYLFSQLCEGVTGEGAAKNKNKVLICLFE
jgi:hypothetical protein